MNDILTEITTAEKRAEEIIEDAKKIAATIIESSKTEIEKRKKEMYDNASKLIESAIEEKRLLAQFESEKIKEDATEELNSLKQKAEKNEDKAISFIISSI